MSDIKRETDDFGLMSQRSAKRLPRWIVMPMHDKGGEGCRNAPIFVFLTCSAFSCIVCFAFRSV
jgi:hypothetical protein